MHSFMSNETRFSSNERKLLLSFFFFILAWPVFGTFTNTFLWRYSHDAIPLAIFNVGLYGALPLGFLLNAFLLRAFQSTRILFAACLLQGIGPLFLTTMHPSSPWVIALLGACLGLPMGLYWGNRNLLTLRATEGRNRMKFLSAESVQNTLAGIGVPVVIGTFLVSGVDDIALGYVLMCVGAFALLLVAGLLIARTNIHLPAPTERSPWIRSLGSKWNALRAFEWCDGVITMNESVISLLIILHFFGVEDAVGRTKSAVSILAAILLFTYGKRVRLQDHSRVLLASFGILCGASVFFALRFDVSSAAMFFVGGALVSGFRGTVMMTTVYSTIDDVVMKKHASRFLLLLDREIFLNLGRIMTLVAFIGLSMAYPTAVLRYGIVVSTLLHIPLLFFLQKTRDGSTKLVVLAGA